MLEDFLYVGEKGWRKCLGFVLVLMRSEVSVLGVLGLKW